MHVELISMMRHAQYKALTVHQEKDFFAKPLSNPLSDRDLESDPCDNYSGCTGHLIDLKEIQSFNKDRILQRFYQ